jgi:hypothetical protein
MSVKIIPDDSVGKDEVVIIGLSRIRQEMPDPEEIEKAIKRSTMTVKDGVIVFSIEWPFPKFLIKP